MTADRKIGDVLLDVEGVSMTFGGVKALDSVSFDVKEREILAIIGPNGAGKSSMLNCINGFYHPQEGMITFKGIPRHQMGLTRQRCRASPGRSRTSRCSRACRRWTTS